MLLENSSRASSVRSLRAGGWNDPEPKASRFVDPLTVRVAAREVSQRGGGARRGSVSTRGTRLAVEPLWASREPVRPQAQVPSKRKRRASDGYAERISSRSTRLSTPYLASRFETWNLAVREEIDSRLAISLLERFSSRRSSTSFSRRLKLAPGDRNAFRPVRNVF